MAALVANGVAVWDVLRSCRRVGSLDSAVERDSMVANDFESFFATIPSIERVFFNGGAAEANYRRLVTVATPLTYQRLPSTSPAHTMPFAAKLAAWRDRRPRRPARSIDPPRGDTEVLSCTDQAFRTVGEGRMTAAVACRACGAEPRSGARFCDSCGAPIAASVQAAEYKQVTVLFADVVHSMDIASAVGAERLREIMAELLDRFRGRHPALRRHGRQVHRRRNHGDVRRPGGAGGPRIPRVLWPPLDIQTSDPAAGRRRPTRDSITFATARSG